jgi:hypothetical protein
MPVKSVDLPQYVAFCTQFGEKMGPATPPSVEGQSARISGRVRVFGAKEKSGKCARVAAGHQWLTGARLIAWLHHRGHKPPLGGGRLGGERDLCPTQLGDTADHPLIDPPLALH